MTRLAGERVSKLRSRRCSGDSGQQSCLHLEAHSQLHPPGRSTRWRDWRTTRGGREYDSPCGLRSDCMVWTRPLRDLVEQHLCETISILLLSPLSKFQCTKCNNGKALTPESELINRRLKHSPYQLHRLKGRGKACCSYSYLGKRLRPLPGMLCQAFLSG